MREHNYQQLAIGMCGHVVQAWPLVQPIGGIPETICETCTEEKWKVGPNDGLSVWVALNKSPQEDDDAGPEYQALVKKKSPRKPRKKADPMCSICRRKGHLYNACPMLVGQTKIPMPPGDN